MSGYLNRVLKLLKQNVWILDGEERSSSKPLKILYVGSEKNKEYIKKITFEDHCNEEYLGEKWFLYICYLLIINRHKCALAIIEGKTIEQYLYGAVKDFFVPLWLENAISLPLHATHHQAKEDLRVLRKNNLEYIVSKDAEMLHDFYYNMHIPMTRGRYKKGAFEYSYEEIVQKMKKECYELLLIKKQDTIISGLLINECEDIPRLWINGIRDSKYMKKGAIAATYVYGSEYLQKKGYKKVSFGSTRAFLNDGVLHYKKKWDITVSMSKTLEKKGYILKPLILTDGLKSFFENNPFAYRTKDGFYGAVFIDESEKCSEDSYTKFQKKYDIDGLSDLNVFSIIENKIVPRTDCVKIN